MPSARAYGAVVEGAKRRFELGDFAFGPNTDLSSIARQTDDERLEWLIEDLTEQFSMRTPSVVDQRGRVRVPQLSIPSELTVTDLANILDAGMWPESWISPGQFYREGW